MVRHTAGVAHAVANAGFTGYGFDMFAKGSRTHGNSVDWSQPNDSAALVLRSWLSLCHVALLVVLESPDCGRQQRGELRNLPVHCWAYFRGNSAALLPSGGVSGGVLLPLQLGTAGQSRWPASLCSVQDLAEIGTMVAPIQPLIHDLHCRMLGCPCCHPNCTPCNRTRFVINQWYGMLPVRVFLKIPRQSGTSRSGVVAFAGFVRLIGRSRVLWGLLLD